MLNSDGSTTDTTTDSAGGVTVDQTSVTKSATGLSTTTTVDANGDGIMDTTTTDVTVLNADGTTTETVSDKNANGSLRDQTTVTTSADRKTVTIVVDPDGRGDVDDTRTSVLQADGSNKVTDSAGGYSTTATTNTFASSSQSTSPSTYILSADHSFSTAFNTDGSRATTEKFDIGSEGGNGGLPISLNSFFTATITTSASGLSTAANEDSDVVGIAVRNDSSAGGHTVTHIVATRSYRK